MDLLQEKIASITKEPGVYVFKNERGKVLYVGKAKNLLARAKTYFRLKESNDKTSLLVSEIRDINAIPTASEFDAILLEAKLIRFFQPKYNVVARDDKTPLYLVLTLGEPLPRVVLARKSQLGPFRQRKDAVYGPFPSARVIRGILRQLRKAIPFCTQKHRDGKACLYTHLDLCRPCPSVISNLPVGEERRELTRQYRKNIFRLQAIFAGNIRLVIKDCRREMRLAATQLKFEEASQIKQHITALYQMVEHRYDPAVFLDYGADNVYLGELEDLRQRLAELFPHLTSLSRIECVDISHFAGSLTVGSLVVLSDGKPNTSWYRRFRIRTVAGISDTAAISEVLSRRFAHPEWPTPDLLLVDGGKAQLGAALAAMAKKNINLPLLALSKPQEEVIAASPSGYVSLRLPLTGPAIKVLQRLRDESHRFALAYHRLLFRKGLV